jgi:hypothetical protein
MESVRSPEAGGIYYTMRKQRAIDVPAKDSIYTLFPVYL